MKKTLLMVIIIFNFLSFIEASDSTLSNSAKRTLESLNMKIISVKIADGRAKGGQRAMIITYYSSYDYKKHGSEVIQGLEMGYTLNKNASANLDATILIVANSSGKTRAIITCSTKATKRYMNTRKLEKYIKTWVVVWIDKTFLPSIGLNMGW